MENQVIEIRGTVKTVTCNADGKKVLIDKAFTNDVGGLDKLCGCSVIGRLDKLCGCSVIGRLESAQAALYIAEQARETLCTINCLNCYNHDINIPNAAKDGFTLVTCPSCAFGFMAKVNPDEDKVEIFDLTYRQSFPIPSEDSEDSTPDDTPTPEENEESGMSEPEITDSGQDDNTEADQEEPAETLKAS